MNLPYHEDLPTGKLAGCFNNTSATYKFYWFLALLQAVGSGETTISKKHLFARIVANAWYTIHYFHISFGKQDKLQRAIEMIQQSEGLRIDEDQPIIISTLIQSARQDTHGYLNYFNKQVPHWFLSPWLPGKDQSAIYAASQNFENKCLYALYSDAVKINPLWLGYLTKNIRILKDFCYWNLTLYLQSKNPNTPDIANKLVKPALRNSLIKQRRQFWDLVLKETGSVTCIYTGKQLEIGGYAVEHFIPYSFVSHDLIWNLIPADPSFNSSKNNKLPPFEKYFDAFFRIQKEAVSVISNVQPGNKFLEDYLTIFPNLLSTSSIEETFTRDRLAERIQPLLTIAANNGFHFMP